MTFWKPRKSIETRIQQAYFEADYLIERGDASTEDFARVLATVADDELKRDLLAFYITDRMGAHANVPRPPAPRHPLRPQYGANRY